MYRFIAAIAAVLTFWAAPAAPARAELRLVMFEEAGCIYCIRWNEEIGPIYPKTAEGRVAPLRRVDLRGEMPTDIELKSRPSFTPTFVLTRDGVELTRIEGYPGEDFFWWLLAKMLETQPEWNNHTAGGAEG